jgi:hypothetical protein
MGWVVNATPLPLYPRERPGTHFQDGWVGPQPVWTGAENLAPTGIRSPVRPARKRIAIPNLNIWTETKRNYIERLGSYRAVNILPLGYKNR